MYSIHVDWSAEDNPERWTFTGRELEERARGTYSGKNPNGLESDDFIPMMNYAYPLETHPSDDEIRQVHKHTNCTVVYDNDSDKYYLALCAGGMDLSQDIARAYQIVENWIPMDLLFAVSTQPDLSMHGTQWLKMARQIRKQIKIDIGHFKRKDAAWRAAIKEHKEQQKAYRDRARAEKAAKAVGGA